MKTLLALTLAAALGVAAGCSSNDTVAPGNTTTGTSTVQGTINDSDFALTFSTAGTANRLEGPFVLRGSNVHYDTANGALSVDFTVTNAGRVAHAEPVRMQFLKLFPDSVEVQNPDSTLAADGVWISFQFSDGDGIWSPGETSEPRTVRFGVGPGISIGFIAMLQVGETPPTGEGVIGGRLWNDANKDGVMDPDEVGIGGAPIVLRNITGSNATAKAPPTLATKTGPDGHYEFHHLPAGVYVVSDLPATPRLTPTTPTGINVVLTTKDDGTVSSFLDANFGCVPTGTTPPPWVGRFIHATGTFDPLPLPHLTLSGFEFQPCDTVPQPDATAPGCNEYRLRGPVTGVFPDRHAIEVMGTPVRFNDVPKDIQMGDRIDVRVRREDKAASPLDGWVVVEWQPWTGENEEVSGRVDAVTPGAEGLNARVTGVWVGPLPVLDPLPTPLK